MTTTDQADRFIEASEQLQLAVADAISRCDTPEQLIALADKITPAGGSAANLVEINSAAKIEPPIWLRGTPKILYVLEAMPEVVSALTFPLKSSTL